MTVWDLLAACRRRWLLVTMGILMTAGAFAVVKAEDGVYWAQTDVVFLAPPSATYPNSLSTGTGSLIATVGLVEREVNDGQTLKATSSGGVNLVDQGVRDGTLVRLPNYGGQWAYNFERPVLDVEAVAATPGEVNRRMADLEAKIQSALDRRQLEAGVDPVNRITLKTSPAQTDVMYSQGDRRRAAVATVFLGVGVTLATVVIRDRRKRVRIASIDGPPPGQRNNSLVVNPPGHPTKSESLSLR